MKKYSSGYTLIELLLFMGLFSVILLVLTTLFSELVQKQLELQSVSAIESDRAYLLSRLKYDLARADSVLTPSGAGETSAQLDLDIGGQTYTYLLNGDNLILENSSESLQLNTVRSQISGVSFQRLGNPGGNATIQINIDIISKTQEAAGPRTTSVETTLGTR